MLMVFFYFLAILFISIGLFYIIINLNLLVIDYNFSQYLIYIFTHVECLLFFLGILLLLIIAIFAAYVYSHFFYNPHKTSGFSVVVDKVKDLGGAQGYDALNDEFVDMFKAGIVDPAKVTRSALQNAASIASMLLTTEAAIVDIPEEKPAMPDMSGMGGMGGMM